MTNPNNQKPNKQIEKDEIELAHDRWLSAPVRQKWYLDRGSNGNPLAELAFRRYFVAAAKIAIELVCNSPAKALPKLTFESIQS